MARVRLIRFRDTLHLNCQAIEVRSGSAKLTVFLFAVRCSVLYSPELHSRKWFYYLADTLQTNLGTNVWAIRFLERGVNSERSPQANRAWLDGMEWLRDGVNSN